MDREVITLFRDLRPDEGVGEAMDQMVALVHHAYLTWAAGAVTIPIARDTAEEVLSAVATDGAEPKDVTAYYAQFPERMIWARVIENEAPEPLDGLFVSRDPRGCCLGGGGGGGGGGGAWKKKGGGRRWKTRRRSGARTAPRPRDGGDRSR